MSDLAKRRDNRAENPVLESRQRARQAARWPVFPLTWSRGKRPRGHARVIGAQVCLRVVDAQVMGNLQDHLSRDTWKHIRVERWGEQLAKRESRKNSPPMPR